VPALTPSALGSLVLILYGPWQSYYLLASFKATNRL